ncbi:MAG: hypothetical protein AAFQ40_00615 [Cyanobacteria bacterium J06623_5]
MNALSLPSSVTVPNNASDAALSLLEGSSSSETTSSPELLAAPTFSPGEGEPLRHILLGTPGGVRQTIHLLHTLRYVENALWSPLVPIPDDQLIITPRQGEVMSLLIRNLRA